MNKCRNSTEELNSASAPHPHSISSSTYHYLTFDIFATTSLLECLNTIDAHLVSLSKSGTSSRERVHQLRIAARKALSAIQLFDKYWSKKEAHWLQRNLKQLLRVSNNVREADVMLKQSNTHHGAISDFEKSIRRQRDNAQKKLTKCLRKLSANGRFGRKTQSLILHRRAVEAKRTRLNDWSGRQMAKIFDRLEKSVPNNTCNLKRMHHFRLRAKQARYALELITKHCSGEYLDDWRSFISELQRRLGKINDLANSKHRLKEWWRSHKRSSEARQVIAKLKSQDEQLQLTTREYSVWWDSSQLHYFRTALSELFISTDETIEN